MFEGGRLYIYYYMVTLGRERGWWGGEAGPGGQASSPMNCEEGGCGCDGHAPARPVPGGDEGLRGVGGDGAVWMVGLVGDALGSGPPVGDLRLLPRSPGSRAGSIAGLSAGWNLHVKT